jgi:hypothetical protein
MSDQPNPSRQQQQPRMAPSVARSSTGLPPHRRFDESWVEVASQPSSSSLSSIGDEIITTGLQVGGPHRRRRRMQASAISLPPQQTAIYAADTSSQGEYEDSESEDDRLLSSSAENMRSSPEELEDADESDSDDADNATALGRLPDRPVFRPQPNAFSHPPTHLAQRSYSASTATPPSHPHSDFTRPSFTQRSQTRVSSGSPTFMTPSREDNDAALRASLTTLLSCAAAARGLPKTREEAEAQRTARAGIGPSNQPMGLRLVPESELMEEHPAKARTATDTTRSRSSPSSPSLRPVAAEKTKRSNSTGRPARGSRRRKAVAASEEALISPTLLTWVVSAGVVVLVSVVGFGAGYVIGREVGRQETLAVGVGGVNETSSCGREVIRSSSGGLRRFKWGTVGKSIVA